MGGFSLHSSTLFTFWLCFQYSFFSFSFVIEGLAGGCHLCANGSMHYNMLFWIVLQFLPTAHNSNWVLCRPNNKRKFFRLDPIMISTYLQIDILAEISSLGRKNGPLSQSLPSALIRHKKRYYSATIRIKNKIWNISVLKSSSTVLFNLALALFVKIFERCHLPEIIVRLCLFQTDNACGGHKSAR